jgi:signal transduction histidine kinase
MWKVLLIAVLIAFLTLLHYLTDTNKIVLHDLHRQLFYIPIILSAFWFGLKGGLVTSVSISILYFPVIASHSVSSPFHMVNLIFELALFNLVGAVTGLLAEGERAQKERYQRASERLAKSLEQLKEHQEELRKTDKLKVAGQLAAGIAHEIRNPLNAIEGCIEILRERHQASKGREEELIRIITDETGRIKKIITDFLSFAKPAAPNFYPCDVNVVVKNMLPLINHYLTRQNINVELRMADNLPQVRADSEQLKQAFLNVMLNAIEAMPEGGSLKISSMRSSMGSENGTVEVTFQDTGYGISGDDMKNLFEPFFTTKKGGTGLGLSIVRRIVETHIGTIQISSCASAVKDGGRCSGSSSPGTTVTIKFPAQR